MSPTSHPFHRLIFFVGIIIILISSLVLVGWQIDDAILKSWVPGLTPMNPMTAILFILCGTWLILALYVNKILLNGIACIIAFLGLWHFMTYFTLVSELRMDYLLFGQKIYASGIPPLIAPDTALGFLLTGFSMLLSRKGSYKLQVGRQFLLVILFLTVYISGLGYIFNIQSDYRIGGLNPMAFISTVTFLLLIPGLFFTDIRYGVAAIFSSPLQGGRLMRIMVPFVLVFPAATGYLRIAGEKRGWYPSEVGVELFTFIFTLSLLFCISFYAWKSNQKEGAEQKIITMMIALNEGVLQLDANGCVTFCNPAFEHILGYSKEEIIGRSPINFIVPYKDRNTFLKRLDDRRRGIEEDYKNELLTKEGKTIYISIKSKPLKNEWGSFDGTLISIRDITEETLNIQDLQAFSSSAAHDLNSPLAIIQSLSNMIDTEQMEEEQKFLVAHITIESQRMRDLLDDLLTFSKMGSSQMPIVEVDISTILQEIIHPFNNLPVVIIKENLPVITANIIAVRQLLTNLVSNAVKYSSKSDLPTIKINSYIKENRTWISISDNGIGLEKNKLKELFKPFKRFTNQFEGNGLGLAIVKRIIERHGGDIYATINEDAGLTFHFTLNPEIRI